jgi:hypothetical protein
MRRREAGAANARNPQEPGMNSFQVLIRRSVLGALAATLLAAPAFGQEPVYPMNSRLGLVPPPGFVAAPPNKFPGFENPGASAAILLAELPPEAYADLEKGFTDETLKQRGMTVALREPMTLKGGKGVFISGTKTADGVNRAESVLIASVSGVTAIVSVQMIEASKATITDAVVREALKTVAVRQVPDSEKLGVLPYKIGNLGGFRVVRSAPNGTALLTQGASDAVTDVAQPFMLIGMTGGQAVKAEEREAFARRVLSVTPGIKEIKVVRAEPLRIGQGAGFEILAEAKDARTGTDVTTVQWLRFGQSGYMQMFGIARKTAWNEVFPRLRTIRDNIELGR